MKQWYKIEAKTSDISEIWIYEEIGEDIWDGTGVSAKAFQKELSDIKSPNIHLHINSFGGQVFEGIAIFNLLKQHPAVITTYIDGLAASIASVIALAGDKVIMASNALYMIHLPWGVAQGTANDMRDTANILDKIKSTMTTIYLEKCNKKKKDKDMMSGSDIDSMMEEETWLTAQEAYDMGFCDEIGEKMDMAACVKFVPAMAKAGFKHIPKIGDEPDNKPQLTIKNAEKSLRDAGFSHKDAKAILSEGFKGYQRDVDSPLAQRDVASSIPQRIDRVAALLQKAEEIAPTRITI